MFELFISILIFYNYIPDLPGFIVDGEIVIEEPEPTPVIADHWLRLADCESGDWDANANPIPGSARWDYGAPGGFTHAGFEQFHGGLNFHPDTWSWVAPMVGVESKYAYQASPEDQVRVGEKTQELQGWKAWPVCSKKIGLR